MNYLHLNNLRLATRSEGKIKSYESCTDVRAWSHDLGAQDKYLREWMKRDMPSCFIPCNAITDCLTRMTFKSRRRATPRCHPDCKSKMILDTICNSCRAVKECLQRNEGLEKYFVEEELESSQWPCDKCLDALKSIKMFWKILVDKIFGINLSHCGYCQSTCERPDSVKSVARLWQSDIIQQASFVSNIPSLCGTPELCRRKTCSLPDWKWPWSVANDYESSTRTYSIKPPYCVEKYSRCTSVRVKTDECGCNTSRVDLEDELFTYKRQLSSLETKCNMQNEDLKKLRQDNCMLRKELESIRQGCPWKASFFLPEENNIGRRSVTIVPKPFECHMEDSCCPVNNIDSEMIITMKNGKNESFRYVSLLQVLHKTNDPIIQDKDSDSQPYSKKEDPIEILNKVHNTVGAIVKREMCIANDKKCQPKKTEVDATFHRLHGTAPTASSMSSHLSCEDLGNAKENECGPRACIRVTNI